MKRLYISIGVLLLLLGLSLGNLRLLRQSTQQLQSLVAQTQAHVQSGDYESAARFAQLAQSVWDEQDLYLHIVLSHEDTDRVEADLHELSARLAAGDENEFFATAARLSTELRLLWENERGGVRNVL